VLASSIRMQRTALFVLSILVVFTVLECEAKLPFKRSPTAKSKRQLSDDETPYNTYYYNQTLDHFDYNTKPLYFSQRYLVSDLYWDGKGPILFYTGNEGDITSFWNNTGFVTTTLPPMFNGLVVFAEHRYYGESLPFGELSFTSEHIRYLTTEQALADYAELIDFLKDKYNAQSSAVIAFGGSYGGMLSSWFRIKYPNVVDGAIAASAPILLFLDTGASQWAFNEIITNDYEQVSPLCPNYVRSAFDTIQEMGQTSAGAKNLSTIFHLCNTLEPHSLGSFIEWIENGFTSMAMADYPYACDFLTPMPGWPVNVSCQAMLTSMEENGDVLQAMYEAINIYYNYTGAYSCYSLEDTSEGGDIAWSYQACTEMIFPISSNGTSDMFPPAYFNLTETMETCNRAFGVQSRPYWITTTYGGRLTPNKGNNIIGSNIVFSNGMLDPWGSGGVLNTITNEKDMIAVYMSESAHHLDMRLPNSADPESVQNGRQIEIEYIQEWVDAVAGKNNRVVIN